MVRVTIRFFGSFSRKTSKDKNFIEVGLSNELKEAVLVIKKEIEKVIGNDVLYTVILNGKSMSLVTDAGITINDDDEFYVVPISLGG